MYSWKVNGGIVGVGMPEWSMTTTTTTNTSNTAKKDEEIILKKVDKISMPKIKNIDFQPPLTIIVWEDGTKTFVKNIDDSNFDPEKGAAMAIAKRFLGNKYNYMDTINYYIDKYNRRSGAK